MSEYKQEALPGGGAQPANQQHLGGAHSVAGNIAALGISHALLQQPAAAFGGSAPSAGTTQAQQTQQQAPACVAYSFGNIPAELQALNQWVLWKYVLRLGKWDKVPFIAGALKPRQADTTDPTTWRSFDSVVTAYQRGGYDGIGFVLTAADPYVIIDADDKPEKPATPDEHKMFKGLYRDFATYTELSVSGRGMHIVCKGKLPDNKGFRHGSLEVYSSSRYMAFTGNTDLSSLPFLPEALSVVTTISDTCQPELDELVTSLRAEKQSAFGATDAEIDVPETKTMDTIWQELQSHENAPKFNALWNGEWQALELGDGSQSAADMSLIEFFRFSGATMQQAENMFRASALYRPPPTKHATYVRRTVRSAFRIGLAEKLRAEAMKAASSVQVEKLRAESTQEPAKQVFGELDYPPGFAGRMAEFIFKSSYLPVKEVAIVTALGCLAGVCGRAYNIPSGKGLSLLIILVGRSGIGKDALHEGSQLMFRLLDTPEAWYFIDDNDYGSGPALHKAILNHPGFVNVQGEFGRKLKRMANPKDSPMQELRTVITDSFGKKRLAGKGLSKSEDSFQGVERPAYSLIGETTPSTFYECITDDMMADGFLSRFLIVEYHGDRPDDNDFAGQWRSHFGEENLSTWKTLVERCIPYCQPPLPRPEKGEPPPTPAEPPEAITTWYKTDESRRLLLDFRIECRDAVRASGSDEKKRQMWNRAHLKASIVASLLAAADNPMIPAIDEAHAQWAINLVRRDTGCFNHKLDSGDIGDGDDVRGAKIISLAKSYFVKRPGDKYVTDEIYSKGLIPLKYFSTRTANIAAFKKHPLGANKSLHEALNTLCKNGDLCLLEKDTITLMGIMSSGALYMLGSAITI